MPRGVYVRTDAMRRRQSEAMMGKIPWNKGFTKETDKRVATMSESKKGHEVSPETRRRISEAKKGRPSWHKGKPLSEEHKRCLSEALTGRFTGSDSPHWKGGIFKYKRRDLKLIEIFRAKSPDGIIKCYFCGKPITKISGLVRDALVIHSLDENHENWDSSNKVPTHRACHSSFHNQCEKNPMWLGDAASDNVKRRRPS